MREAFLREAQTIARLTHPNIVPVYQAGEKDGFAYMVMAFIDGMTLGERIRTRGPMPAGHAARMLREVAWALAYAHTAGIVHRDVSAENILLERGSERAVVMDFGIASAMQSAAISDDGRVMGNAHYVSPEQAVGEPVDARSDLYSLGVCGFFALTGRLPFDASTTEDIVRLHLTAPVPGISRLAHAVPPRLAHAVERCLAKDPDDRFANAAAFAEAIDLAFEHAKEIPIALRVWIQHGEKESGPRAMLMLWGAVLGSITAAINGNGWLFPAVFAAATALGSLPIVTRLRRALKEGYTVEDLHGALREHELVRNEEQLYMRRTSSVLSPGLRVMLVGSGSSMVALSFILKAVSAGGGDIRVWRGAVAATALFATMSTVGLASSFLRQRVAPTLASWKLRFWQGPWGERLARIAGLGLTVEGRPSLGVRMHTEVALGRATDHLFRALPRELRNELAELPGIVHRLESDAAGLRASIDSIDDHLSVLERSTRRPGTNATAARSTAEDELREERELAAERLASTVSALEGIRLGLLRLQMGSAGVESVTASLAAAQRVGEQIAEAVEARSEVERLLKRPGTSGELGFASNRSGS
jgi:eukaryotic-like serine/threonine-protein kinase